MMSPSSSEPGQGSRRALPDVPFEIIGEIGRGSYGVVYHVRLSEAGAGLVSGSEGSRDAALKVARLHVNEDPVESMTRYRRFLRESRVLQRMDPHPNVVGVRDVGQTEAGEHWILLDLVTGASLRKLMDAGPLPYERLVDIVLGVASGLDHIHSCGILHRDLKPENILLDERGFPRITDLGLARFSGGERSITASDEAVGTPLYMSPEMASFQPDSLGPWSDVFSLGVILFELISGRLPFTGRTATEVLEAICCREPEPLSPLNREVPDELIEVCRRALEKSPRRRYSNCGALLDDLLSIDGFQQRAPSLRSSSLLERGDWSPGRGGVARLSRLSRTLIAVVCSLVVAVVLWVAVRERHGPDPERAGSTRALPKPNMLLEGDYSQVLTGPVLRARDLLAGEPSRPESALAVLEANADAAGRSGVVLRAELLGLLRSDPAEAWSLLDAAGLRDHPLGMAQEARILADRGNVDDVRRLLERAREVAGPAGLLAAVERVFEGGKGAEGWLASRGRQANILAGRTGSGRWRVEADRLLVSLAARAPGTGFVAFAMAEGHLERRQPQLAEQSASLALQAGLDSGLRGEALLLRARARLAMGSFDGSVADATAARENGADLFLSGEVEVEALIASSDPDAVPRAGALVKAALEADPSRPRPWSLRVWRMRVLESRALEAAGEIRAALQSVRALALEVGRQAAFWRSLERFERTSRGIDLGESLLRDPDDASGLVLRAVARLRHGGDLELQRAGLADLVRAADWWIPAVIFWKLAREGPEQLGLATFADKETLGGDDSPLTSEQQQLFEVLVALDGTGAEAADPRRALALNAKLLEVNLLRPEIWLVQAHALYLLGRHSEAEEVLVLVRQMAPFVSEAEVLELLFRDEEDRQRLAVERLVTAGLGGDLLQAIWRMRDGGKLFPPGWERRGVSVRECLQALRTERFLGLLAIPEVRSEPRRLLAESEGADWALHWYLIGAARSLEAQDLSSKGRRVNRQLQSRLRVAPAAELDALRAQVEGVRGGISKRFRAAAAAFERAAALAGKETGPVARVYRAAQVFSLVQAGDADAGLEGFLTRCLREQEQVMPIGQEVFRVLEAEPFYFQQLRRFHQLSYDRASLLAYRARVRLQRGNLELAKRDAERAATLHVGLSEVLVAVYEAMLQKAVREGSERR